MDELSAAGIDANEIPVSPDRLVVVYQPPDTGSEVDPVSVLTLIAGDAGRRAPNGWELASLTSMNLRHAALFMGRQGSGFESKVAIIAVYAKA
ncbi:MAG TPA: hypothetical protein VKR30_07720 [Candidatus Limnocylindrales bacterium]|nr:hypothetical protein [Candidatus Limnocylindrales bacterium]